MKNVRRDPAVFMGVNGNPMDVLGIGANMVKALRYWLQAVELTSEPSKGKRTQTLTPFGDVIFQHDKYIEEIGTLWLLHYKLAKNLEDATAWSFFFNEFNMNEFTRDDFISQLTKYIRIHDVTVSDRSLDDDYTCIINTYVPRIKSNPEKVLPESNIDCPFGELGLIDIVSKKDRVYKKCIPKKDTLHPLILLAVIIDNAKDGEREIKISTIHNDINNAGKIFCLDIITLINSLSKIESLGYIKVVRTAGLDVIEITTKMNFIDCVQEYYKLINA